MNTQTMMRTDKKLLEAIKGLKKHRRESYADVIERLVDNERKV
jgi:predicted CopG family antitoxin